MSSGLTVPTPCARGAAPSASTTIATTSGRIAQRHQRTEKLESLLIIMFFQIVNCGGTSPIVHRRDRGFELVSARVEPEHCDSRPVGRSRHRHGIGTDTTKL